MSESNSIPYDEFPPYQDSVIEALKIAPRLFSNEELITWQRYVTQARKISSEFDSPGSRRGLLYYNSKNSVPKHVLDTVYAMQFEPGSDNLIGQKIGRRNGIEKWLKDGSIIVVTNQEKVSGWLNFYDPDKEFLSNIANSGIILQPDALPIEVSFQSHKSAGTIPGALISTIERLRTETIPLKHVTDANLKNIDQIVFLGSIDPTNRESIAVHLAAGFSAHDRLVPYLTNEPPAELFTLHTNRIFKI